MIEYRSASQILYGFLPQQTVDVGAKVWRVAKWRNPQLERNVDIATLRKEICRLASPWRITKMDDDYVTHLEGNAPLEVYTLDRTNGVELEPFPRIWMCRMCKRIHSKPDANCPCSSKLKGQLPFVHYHNCGAIREPYIPKCPTHNQVMLVSQGSSALSEIRFECPVCRILIRQGFGFPRCECGQEVMSITVHRAASVFTPRSVVIVNPPSPEKIKTIADAGGRPKALSWVVRGMIEDKIDDVVMSKDNLRHQLLAQGIDPKVVEKMLEAAAGELKEDNAGKIELPKATREEAEAQAVTIALATTNSRLQIKNLAEKTDPLSENGLLYRDLYPVAFEKAGISTVEFIDSFPVLSGHYAYTRGGWNPGESRLRPYRDKKAYRVYADLAETEALFIKLSPLRVVSWLKEMGHELPDCKDEVEARILILQQAVIPRPGENLHDETVGTHLLQLIHSYAHKFIRSCAVWAGIDRNALSELLVPLHLGFYVYAAAKGDFVLGGLQAVFESDLNRVLAEIVQDDHRCPLDPGCHHAGGACVACLHLGEPSCRYFNRFLSRSVLVGETGYLDEKKAVSPH